MIPILALNTSVPHGMSLAPTQGGFYSNITVPDEPGNIEACVRLGNPFIKGDAFSGVTCLSEQVTRVIDFVAQQGYQGLFDAIKNPVAGFVVLAIIIIGYNMLSGNEQSIRKPLLNVLMIGMAFIIFTAYGNVIMPKLKGIMFETSSKIGQALNPFETLTSRTYKHPVLSYLESNAPPMIDYAFSKGMQLSMAIMASGVKSSLNLSNEQMMSLIGDPKHIGLLGCTYTPIPPGWHDCYQQQVARGIGVFNAVSPTLSKDAIAHCNNQFNVQIKDNDYLKSPGFYTLMTDGLKNLGKSIAQFFALLFIGFIVLFCAATWAITAGMMYLTNYIRGILLLLLAPIFFIFFFFNKTRDMTQKWAQNLISIMMLNIILVACISFFVYIMDVVLAYIHAGTNCDVSPFSSGLMAALMFLLLASMTKNIPVIVQELTGSSGQSGSDVTGSALSFGTKAITAFGAGIAGLKYAKDLATDKMPGMLNKISDGGSQGKMSKP